MKTTEICIKTVAILVMIAALSCAWGRDAFLSAFAENKRDETDVLGKCKSIKNLNVNSTEAKLYASVIKSVNSGEGAAFSLLCKSIKYNCKELGDCIYIYNSNQIMIYDKYGDECLYFRYDCPVGAAKYDAEGCAVRARSAFLEVYSEKEDVGLESIECIIETDKICGFCIHAFGEERFSVRVDIRRDSGSIILFDALGTKDTVMYR